MGDTNPKILSNVFPEKKKAGIAAKMEGRGATPYYCPKNGMLDKFM